MRHRKRRVIEGSWFNLNSVTSPTSGRKHYEISVNFYRLSSRKGPDFNINMHHADIRNHFDPAGNRGAKLGTKWKYTNRETAEQLLTMALLKWGA
jgi:hypothetical protein